MLAFRRKHQEVTEKPNRRDVPNSSSPSGALLEPLTHPLPSNARRPDMDIASTHPLDRAEPLVRHNSVPRLDPQPPTTRSTAGGGGGGMQIPYNNNNNKGTPSERLFSSLTQSVLHDYTLQEIDQLSKVNYSTAGESYLKV